MRLPYLDAPEQSRLVTNVFGGINETLYPGDGEWYRMKNLTTDHYPLLAVRDKRRTDNGNLSGAVTGMIWKDSLYEVIGTTLYANGAATAMTGLQAMSITAAETAPESPTTGSWWYQPSTGRTKRYSGSGWVQCGYPRRQLVGMGAYIVIFPDKKYYNTEDPTDYGRLEASATAGAAISGVSLRMCKADGTDYGGEITESDTEPTKTNGALWLDTGKEGYALYQYSESQKQWVAITGTTVKVILPSGGSYNFSGFSTGDGVTVENIDDTVNGSKLLRAVGDNWFCVSGILRAKANITIAAGSTYLRREVPEMDYVIEAGNRLWGCKYGMVGGDIINELYCSKLGDFRNWNVFQGISTDSWAASVGSDGQWTGAVNYLGYPTFFKEDTMHRISISASGAHSVGEVRCRGVKKGCEGSLAMADEILYFVGRDGICAYDGSLPYSISEKLVSVPSYAEGETFDGKYYLSGDEGMDGGYRTLVYDIKRGLWTEESGRPAMLCRVDDSLVAAWYDGTHTGWRHRYTGKTAVTSTTEEDAVEWMAESGIMGYEYTDRKYLSRFDIRMILPKGASMVFDLMYDESGIWNRAGTITGTGTNSFVMPVRPRRCDTVRMRLSGKGAVRIYSISRVLEVGSDE